MKCKKCNNTGELKVFSSFKYYYCSTCKVEIPSEETTATLSLDDLKRAKDALNSATGELNFDEWTEDDLELEFNKLVLEDPPNDTAQWVMQRKIKPIDAIRRMYEDWYVNEYKQWRMKNDEYLRKRKTTAGCAYSEGCNSEA